MNNFILATEYAYKGWEQSRIVNNKQVVINHTTLDILLMHSIIASFGLSEEEGVSRSIEIFRAFIEEGTFIVSTFIGERAFLVTSIRHLIHLIVQMTGRTGGQLVDEVSHLMETSHIGNNRSYLRVAMYIAQVMEYDG